MSYATIYKVPESGGIENYREFPNAIRGAVLLWTYLSRRYLDLDGMPLFGGEDTKRLWALATDERLSEDERIALQTTFDGVMVRRDDFERVAAAFDVVGPMMDDAGHLPAWAATLREMWLDPDCFAACWNQTSVCADTWWRYDTCPTCGQDLEDSRMYDISKDSGHWFLFEGGPR